MSLLIRLARAADAAGIAAVYAPYVLRTPITFEEIPPSEAEICQRISDTLGRYPYLVAEDDGRVVGYSYASAHRARASYRWSVDVAIYIAPSHHRRGVGRMFYRQLLSILERQQYAMAYAGITIPNAASVGLHESVGFKQIALYRRVGFKLGQWHDVGWWERPLCKPAEPTPAEPIAFGELDWSKGPLFFDE